MNAYYIITNDGRKFYYRDGVRISSVEGKSLHAHRRVSKIQARSARKKAHNHQRSINPETKKLIKTKGKLYNNLVKRGKINVECNTKVCSPRQLCNPETGKCIKFGGRVYKKLLKQGKSPIFMNQKQNKPWQKSSPVVKTVINPLTGKKIKVGSRVYNKMTRSNH